MQKILKIFIVGILALMAFPGYSHIQNCQPIDINKSKSALMADLNLAAIPYPQVDVERVFRVFLESVENDQLVLFDKVITRSAIKPVRVEYIYTLEDYVPTVKVFSMLVDLIYLPTAPDIQIKGVSTILDQQGNIIEVIVHCGN